jgi:hypothetical protein
MNNTRIVIFISFLFLTIIAHPLGADDKKPNRCKKIPPGITCFKTNFSAIYYENYELFWDTFYIYLKEAKKCNNPQKTADFLSLASAIGGNAEVDEGFAEFSDKMILATPKCYFDAALLLDDASLNRLRYHYWQTSFIGEIEKLKIVIDKYSKNEKYKKLFQ